MRRLTLNTRPGFQITIFLVYFASLCSGLLPVSAKLTTSGTDGRGLRSADPAPAPSPEDDRIVGGRPASFHEFPFLIGIEHKGQPGVMCGASLISPSLVLTAAHCFYDQNGTLLPISGFTLVAGEHNVAVQTGDEQRRKIKTRVVHEQYEWHPNTNDIALVKVDKPFVLGNAVETVQMARPHRGAKEYSPVGCTIAGWGFLYPQESAADFTDDASYPNTLETVHVDLVDKELCMKLYRGKEEETSARSSKVLCAAYLAGGRDACVGDSGGPLVCDEAKEGRPGSRGNMNEYEQRSLLVGIVSGGAGCAMKNAPGLYTDVAKMQSWIRTTASKKLGLKI